MDLRLISATNRDLPSFVRQGKFREDLYYRLAVIPIRIPSLKERPGGHSAPGRALPEARSGGMGKELEGFDEDAIKWLHEHNWPGNVRELENVVERAATLAKGAPSRGTTSGSSSPRAPPVSWACVRRSPRWRPSTSAAVLDEVRGDKRARGAHPRDQRADPSADAGEHGPCRAWPDGLAAVTWHGLCSSVTWYAGSVRAARCRCA